MSLFAEQKDLVSERKKEIRAERCFTKAEKCPLTKSPPQNDSREKRRRAYQKILLFVVGWFTVPFLTGGVWYDLFGGLGVGEIWQRLTHPRELIDAWGVYPLAFAAFAYLPAKISQASWGKRIVYFVLFYFLLCRLVGFLS